MGVVFKGVTAWLPPPDQVGTVDIRVDGRTIESISSPSAKVDPSDTVLQGDGKLALPGLINSHTHAAMTLLRGIADDVPLHTWLHDHVWPIEQRLTEEDVYWGTMLGLMEMIRSGTTQIADMYFHVDAVGRAIADIGMRATISYGVVANAMDDRGRSELDAAERAVDVWHNAADGRIRCAVSPHAVYTCGKEVWKAAIRLAERYTLPIHTHLAETKREVDDWAQVHGVSPAGTLAQLGALDVPLIAAHCVHVSEEDVELLATHHATAVHCPCSNAKLASGLAPVPELLRAQVNVALGTDGAASNNNLDICREMRVALLLQKATTRDATVLDAESALEWATRNGAQALDQATGQLAPGARADIVLMEMDATNVLPPHDPVSAVVYASHPGNVTDVMIDGRFVLRDRQLLTVDEREAQTQAKARSGRLRT